MVGVFAPSGTHQHPGTGGDAPMFAFPLLNEFNGEQKIGVLLDFGGHVNDAGGADKFGGLNGIGGVVGQVLPVTQ